MITTVFLEALFVNWLLMLPAYQNLLSLVRLNRKPFNCSYCLTFWLNIILAFVCWSPVFIVMAVTAPVVSVLIERYLNSLPVKF